MRGLTNEERAVLLAGGGSITEEIGYRFLARGLLVYAPCEDCGSTGGCNCETAYCVISPTGERALRLDAAARAIGVLP